MEQVPQNLEVPTPPLPGADPGTGAPMTVNVTTGSKRLINYLIDGAVVWFITYAIAVLLLAYESDEYSWMVIFIGFAYYIIMEANLGKTVGKFATKTRVLMTDGSKPTASAIVIRTLIRMVPFEPFSILLGGHRPMGWHDRWAKTVVVDDQPQA